MRNASRLHRIVYITALIIAGEAVFALPFHVARFFRPTVLEVFGLTATELGAAQAMYGIAAMLSYFPGGPLADRFPARKLLAASLWSTSCGGLYMASFPAYAGSLALWGFFGVTTILLLWAALIRACRDWGANHEQGLAYGLLDGGRGLLSAVLASLGVLLFGLAFPEGYGAATMAEKQDALRLVIFIYTAVTAGAGVLVWFVIADDQPQSVPEAGRWQPGTETVAAHVARVFRIPAVWLQALIIVCAYVGYKGLDNYTLFAAQVWELDEVEAARILAISNWLRPVAAIAMGVLGDRFNPSRMIMILFAVLLASDLFFALTTPIPGAAGILLANVVITCIAVFGFRGLYYALFEEAQVPDSLTGTATGFVSVLGYTPDIFVMFVAGVMIDRAPGLDGHQQFFWFLAAFALVGFLASLAMMRLLHPRQVRLPGA